MPDHSVQGKVPAMVYQWMELVAGHLAQDMCGVHIFAHYVVVGLHQHLQLSKPPTQQLGGVVPPRGSTLHPPKDHAGVVIHPFVPLWGWSQLSKNILSCTFQMASGLVLISIIIFRLNRDSADKV